MSEKVADHTFKLVDCEKRPPELGEIGGLKEGSRRTLVIRCSCGNNLLELMTEDNKMPLLLSTKGCKNMIMECGKCGLVHFIKLDYPNTYNILPAHEEAKYRGN